MSYSFGSIETLIFFGSGQVLTRSVHTLRGKKRLYVVTGRRQLETASHEAGRTLQQFMATMRVPLSVCDDVNRDPQIRRLTSPTTLGISLGAPWIFQKPLIEAFHGKLINGHGSRLPQDRGGGGFSWRILRGQRTGYSVFHLLTPDLDAGPILRCREYLFPPSCKIPRDFENYAAEEMYRLLHELLAGIEHGSAFEPVAQLEHFSTYWPRLHTETHAYLDWSWGLRDLEAFIDAFDEPYAGASTFLHGKHVRLRKATSGSFDGTFHPFQAGIVYRKTPDCLYVAVNGGTLILSEALDVAGRNILSQVSAGDRFYTPLGYLERAKRTRILFTPRGLNARRHGAPRQHADVARARVHRRGT